MNFTQNILPAFDPTHGLLAQSIKPDKAAGFASKNALKAAGILPGVGAITKSFSKKPPNTAGLNKAKSSYVQMSGAGYEGTAQAARGRAISQNGFPTQTMSRSSKSFNKTGGLMPPSGVCDLRMPKAPNALDDDLAAML